MTKFDFSIVNGVVTITTFVIAVLAVIYASHKGNVEILTRAEANWKELVESQAASITDLKAKVERLESALAVTERKCDQLENLNREYQQKQMLWETEKIRWDVEKKTLNDRINTLAAQVAQFTGSAAQPAM